MIKLLILPLELFFQINTYLDRNDRLECCTVSSKFYAVFKPVLFYNITLTSLLDFMTVIHQVYTQNISLTFTHQIIINCTLPTQDNRFISLLYYCRNLEYLTIGRSFWINQLISGYDDNEVFGGFPMLYCLKHLTVECEGFVSVEDLYTLLSCCPNVKTIILKQLLKITLPKELEKVHNLYCPKLEELYLDHEVAEEDILNNLIDFENETRTTALRDPTKSFKKMRIFHVGLWDDFVILLNYMSFKYPSLEELEINFHPSWQERREYNDLVEVGIFKKAINAFMKKCLDIKVIKFNNVCWADLLFRSQFNSRSFYSQVYLHSDIGISSKTYNILMISSATHITKLDLNFSSVTFLKNNIKDFQRCIKLKNLKLSFIEDDQVLDINIILDVCLRLESLAMDNATLDCKPTKRYTGVLLFPLHQNFLKLTLTRCNFNNTLWLYLEEKCPNLSALDIRFCTHCQGVSIIIYFPKHRFTSIIIQHLRILSPSVVTMNEMKSKEMTASSILHQKKIIEFITIRRFHSTHPDHFIARGPLTFINPKVRLTRSMTKYIDQNGGSLKRLIQTIRVKEYSYTLTEFGYSDDISLNQQVQPLPFSPRILKYYIHLIPGFDQTYIPLESINSIEFLDSRQIAYFRKDGVDIPNEQDMKQLDILYSDVRNKLYFIPPTPVLSLRNPLTPSPSASSSSSSSSTLPSLSSSLLSPSLFDNIIQLEEDRRSHIMIDIYSTMELKINDKWIIF
ncbi:unnamed protein product [Cunninghamella blakesleeana]